VRERKAKYRLQIQTRLAFDDDSGAGRNFLITYTAARTGTHWIRVTPYSEGAALSYSLRWSQN